MSLIPFSSTIFSAVFQLNRTMPGNPNTGWKFSYKANARRDHTAAYTVSVVDPENYPEFVLDQDRRPEFWILTLLHFWKVPDPTLNTGMYVPVPTVLFLYRYANKYGFLIHGGTFKRKWKFYRYHIIKLLQVICCWFFLRLMSRSGSKDIEIRIWLRQKFPDPQHCCTVG
jgi:hypothetical protein